MLASWLFSPRTPELFQLAGLPSPTSPSPSNPAVLTVCSLGLYLCLPPPLSAPVSLLARPSLLPMSSLLLSLSALDFSRSLW